MELKIKKYMGCTLDIFEINNKSANIEDFVDLYDHKAEMADDYCCEDMRADILPATEKILQKYNITKAEYYKIALVIAEKMNIGACGDCK